MRRTDQEQNEIMYWMCWHFYCLVNILDFLIKIITFIFLVCFYTVNTTEEGSENPNRLVFKLYMRSVLNFKS